MKTLYETNHPVKIKRHKPSCKCSKCKCQSHSTNCICPKCRSQKNQEQEFFVRSIYSKIRNALRKGYVYSALRLAITSGQRDENKLTNLIFFSRHPELPKGYKIKKRERRLAKEWIHLRNKVVRPMLRQTPPRRPVPSDYPHSRNTGTNCYISNLIAQAKPKSNAINRARTPRNLNKINAVVLHQMAFNRNNDLHKYLRVTAHYIVMQDGKIGQLHPNTTYLQASNGFNRRSVAIEFAGNFPNMKGRWWKPKSKSKWSQNQVTQAQVLAGRCLLAHLKKTLPNLQYVYAHRQSSWSRINDPGPDLWHDVGEYAINRLGYDPAGKNHVNGSGNPIPIEWTRRRPGR